MLKDERFVYKNFFPKLNHLDNEIKRLNRKKTLDYAERLLSLDDKEIERFYKEKSFEIWHPFLSIPQLVRQTFGLFVRHLLLY